MTNNLRLAVQTDSAVVRSKCAQPNHQVNIAVDTNDLDSHVDICILLYILMLSFFLLLAIFYVYKQMKRLAVARKEVIDTNKRLKELNEELHLSMHKLKEANNSIAENSYLKEEYIGRYMDQ